jgi:menaquinol-cytochrome c reductase cytochrome b/c subunit
MNQDQRQRYLESYRRAKENGTQFFPDIIFKDLLVAFSLFILLVGLAIFLGVAPEPPADPNDSAYIPRPEWYFLFLFQLLKYFPGKLEWVGTVVIPVFVIFAMLLLPFYDRSPFRHWKKRKFSVGLLSVIVLGIIGLTIMAAVTSPSQPESELDTTLSGRILTGQDLYSFYCVECHGADGEGGEIIGVEGLEGVVVKPISSQDEMYTRTDETFFNILDYGQPDLGMPPFGLGNGGEVSRGEILDIVVFMRYTWDERAELPEEVSQANTIPTLRPDEVPTYEVHIQAIVKRYCVSCHRPGKKNNNHLMRTYEEIMTSGDHAPNIVPGDLNSNTILMLHRQEIEAGGVMPPTKALKPALVEIFERWVAAGAPETAGDTE